MMQVRKAILACVASSGVAFAAGAGVLSLQGEYKGWGMAQEKAHVQRREDPATWDMALFEGDKEGMREYRNKPLTFGVFPVPRYDLVGTRSFRGAGTMRMEFPFRGKFVLGNAFFNKRSPVNEAHLGERGDEVFFHILVLSDQQVQPDGSNAAGQVASRNHPHLVGQGMLKTATATVDYVAFLTAERYGYAVVNLRLFDLRAGRVILIAPQQDGTLRSMQVDAPLMSSEEVKNYSAKLMAEPRVVRFWEGSFGP